MYQSPISTGVLDTISNLLTDPEESQSIYLFSS